MSTVTDLILTRMQRLLAIGLDFQPAADVIAITGQVWIERLSRFDPRRLAAAFDTIEATATRWPTPGAIIAALPAYEHTYAEPLPPSQRIAPDPEQLARSRERIDAMIAGLAEKLHMTDPEQPIDRTVSVAEFDALLGKLKDQP